MTCDITFGQNVCELMFGINVLNLNFRIGINPFKQPIQSNSLGSCHVSQCGTSAFHYHPNPERMARTTELMSEAPSHTHGQQEKIRTRRAHLPNTLVGAWHRAPFVNCHVFLPRGSTCAFVRTVLSWWMATDLRISRCAINQPCVDKQEMNPYFVVATLVGIFDSESFMRNFERTVHAIMPLCFRTRWLDEAAHIGPFSWQVRVGKRLLKNAVAPLFVTWSTSPCGTPLKSPATMSTCSWCIAVRTASNIFSRFRPSCHNGSCEVELTIMWDPPKRGTWDNGLKDPTWLAFFHILLLPRSGVVNSDGVNPGRPSEKCLC